MRSHEPSYGERLEEGFRLLSDEYEDEEEEEVGGLSIVPEPEADLDDEDLRFLVHIHDERLLEELTDTVSAIREPMHTY